MSNTAQLVCRGSRQFIWLGKPVRGADSIPFLFHIGGPDNPRLWNDSTFVRSLLKFFATNFSANLEILLDSEFEDLADKDPGWLWIGNDAIEDVTFDDYLQYFDEAARPENLHTTQEGRDAAAFLVCTETLDRIRLGIPYRAKGRIQHFYLEDREKLSEDIPRMQAIFKFLAENTGKKLRVILEDELNELQTSGRVGREIGSARPGGIGFEEYLKGWPGLE